MDIFGALLMLINVTSDRRLSLKGSKYKKVCRTKEDSHILAIISSEKLLISSRPLSQSLCFVLNENDDVLISPSYVFALTYPTQVRREGGGGEAITGCSNFLL